MSIDLKKGLPRLREEWIVGRGDVEQLPEITSEYGQMRRDDKSLDHLRFEHIALPYRAKKGEAITTKTLDVLCYILDCPVSDIIEHDKTK